MSGLILETVRAVIRIGPATVDEIITATHGDPKQTRLQLRAMAQLGLIEPAGRGTPKSRGPHPIKWRWTAMTTHRTARVKLADDVCRCAPAACGRREHCARYMAPLAAQMGSLADFSIQYDGRACLAFISVEGLREQQKKK